MQEFPLIKFSGDKGGVNKLLVSISCDFILHKLRACRCKDESFGDLNHFLFPVLRSLSSSFSADLFAPFQLDEKCIS